MNYQKAVNGKSEKERGYSVTEARIKKCGKEYRSWKIPYLRSDAVPRITTLSEQ